MENSISQLAIAWALLSAINQQVVENVFGAYVQGRYMKLLAVASGIAVTFGAWELASLVPDLASIAALKWGGVLALGFFVGTGSNLVHGLVNRLAPDAKALPLLSLPKKSRQDEYLDRLNAIERDLLSKKVSAEAATLRYKLLRTEFPDQPDLRPGGFSEPTGG